MATDPSQVTSAPSRLSRAARAARQHPIRVASAICVLAAGSAAAATPGWTRHQLALSLNPQPVHYTELFFTNISTLPLRSRPGVAHAVAFTIVNRQGRALRYSYAVSLATPAARVLAGQGQVMVKDNQKADVVAHIMPKSPNTTYTVTITIHSPPEVIEFHGRTT